MGSFKEQHGKTRVGKFLEDTLDKTSPLLKLVGDVTGVEMLSNLGNIIAGTPELTPDQKIQANNLLQQDIQDEREQLTQRQKNDMDSDSWLSKNVRPIIALGNWLVVFVLIILDSKGIIQIKTEWHDLIFYQSLSSTGFYFGLREVGKFRQGKGFLNKFKK